MTREKEPKHELFDAVFGQDWAKVVDLFKDSTIDHATKVTKSEDTALHVAIINLEVKDTYVVKLVDEIEKTDTCKCMNTLSAKNTREDTPLHCAASRGFLGICKRIIRADKWLESAEHAHESLVCKRNKDGETPLFLAALNGHKKTFLFLHSVCSKMPRSTSILWRRKNGDTILHCTIQRDYFELSFQIIHLYKDQDQDQDIASALNEEGISPLGALAFVPSAFESGTHLTWWDRCRYKYIRVEPLKIDSTPIEHVLDVGNSDTQQTHFLKEDPPPVSRQTRASIRRIKEKHVWGDQIMNELVKRSREYQYSENVISNEDLTNEMELLGKMKEEEEENQEDKQVIKLIQEAFSTFSEGKSPKRYDQLKKDERSSALLIAAKYGLLELVDKILHDIPMAIHYKTNIKERNILLVAVQKRQTRVLQSLMKHPLWLSLREVVDVDGNNALHLAATLPEYFPWEISGAAMQMQWEVKWFEYVKENMPPYLNSQGNKDGDTPEEIFAEQHKKLIKASNTWLKDTSGSYSIVAALTAGVTYATSYTFPGGTDDAGKPILVGQPAFDIFAIAVLVSFFFSVTSLAAFLAVYSSRMQSKEFHKSLPLKLFLGLTSFYISIVAMLVSFCAAHSFELNRRMKHKVSPWYSLTLVPLFFYAAAQVPLYWDLVKASFTKVPKPKYVGEDVPT